VLGMTISPCSQRPANCCAVLLWWWRWWLWLW